MVKTPERLCIWTRSWKSRNSEFQVALQINLDQIDIFLSAITRELPYNYPYAVKEHYVARFTKRWPLPANKLFQKVESHFSEELDALVVKHFSRFAPGELDEAVQ
jgi:hypothetical protein